MLNKLYAGAVDPKEKHVILMELGSKGSVPRERRANVRLNRVLAIALGLDDNFCSTVAVDLSVSGFQVATSFPLEPGQVVPVKLHLSHTLPIEGTAEVKWCEKLDLGLFRLGCQFEEMKSVDDFERLCKFVEKERLNADGLSTEVPPTLELATQVTLRTLTDQEIDRFAVLGKISELLNGCYELQELLDKALKITVEATGAERGMLLLDRGGADYEIPAFHAQTQSGDKNFSRCVVERVESSGQPLLSLDAQRDERLSGSNSLRVMGTRSILCIPITSRKRSFGYMYLDSSVRAGALTQSDLKLAAVIAGMAASAIERAEDFSILVQNEKLAAMGTLTAGLLHELSNPLGSILGLGELLHMEVGGELTEELLEEARRCRSLVQDLLRLSRKGPVKLSLIQLEDVVGAAVNAVKTELDRNDVELILEQEAHLPPVMGNPDHLRQVLLNLLSNAIYEAGKKEDGKVEIRLKCTGPELLLVVADNGDGIPAASLNKLSDPFFTTKGPDEGTGLGLTIIQRIVTEHGGTLSAENRCDRGALFRVVLPLAETRSDKIVS